MNKWVSSPNKTIRVILQLTEAVNGSAAMFTEGRGR